MSSGYVGFYNSSSISMYSPKQSLQNGVLDLALGSANAGFSEVMITIASFAHLEHWILDGIQKKSNIGTDI